MIDSMPKSICCNLRCNTDIHTLKYM